MLKSRILLLFSIAFLLISSSGCQLFRTPDTHREVPPEEFGKKYEVSDLKSDLDFLVRTLEAVHPDLYAYTPREEFYEERRRIEQRLASPLTRIELYFRIAPLAAMLKDGHTKIYPVYEEYFHHIRENGLLFPLDVEIRDGATIVTANYSPDSVPVVGSEVLSINGVETGIIIDEFLPLVSGERLEKCLEYLADFYRHLLWLKYRSEGPFALTFISSDGGEIREREISGVTYWDIEENKQAQGGSGKNYSYRTLRDGSIGLLDITLFPGDESYGDFLKTTFGDIKRQGIRNLIIDIRENGGGYSPAAIELLRYLSNKPIARIPRMDIKVSDQIKEYYRLSLPKLLRWFPMQWIHPTWRKIWNAPEGGIVTVSSEPEKLNNTPLRFDGTFYVLIGPGTFSTATHFAAMVKDYDLGELVGTETGGLATSFGDFYPFDLPNTRLLVRVSHKRIFRPSSEDNGRGVLPDHPVTHSREDIAEGIDPVLEYTIDLIQPQDGETRYGNE